MKWNPVERLVAAAVFVYALILYVLTVAPTASFWDSGEFLAIAHGLQVSHPPGAPFYMLVGRLFSIVLTPLFGLFTETGAVALSVNLVSVVASALTVLLTHLIIVRLIRLWQGAPEAWTAGDRIAALVGGVVGACTFAVTDSFWFNAVEAEVYALSMFFTAAVVWLIMRWSEAAKQEEAMLAGGQHPFGLAANRYLVLIAYLFGLAIGVHLLNLLAIFFIALIFFYNEIERPDWSTGKRWGGIIAAGAISALIFFAIYPGIIKILPQIAGDSGAPTFVLLLVVGLVAAGVWYTQKNGMQAANLAMLCVTMVLVGYSTYALIFIRSAADPPIDENDPETVDAMVSYLNREQYGDIPLLSGPTYDDAARSLSRTDKYFPRRHSPDPMHWRVYQQYDSDWEYFWDYQVGHMYLRYFGWNFIGRAGDWQNAPAISGFADVENAQYLYQTPSERASRNAYYGLPLLLGLIGAAFHFVRDWRRAFAVFILFFVTGLGIILYLNQPPLQPRERDYSYVASFFAFSLWVGIGAGGLLQLMLDVFREKNLLKAGARKAALVGTGALLFAAVPVLMLAVNYDDHDRSGRYVAPEYAYNMLMSVDDHGILFTNGDNDTFPLWYLQEVEGVRRDVRVVNLSLLNTPWYVKQLKEQASRTSEPLPITLSDQEIEELSIAAWRPREMSLPVDQDDLIEPMEGELPIALNDTSLIQSPMTWTLEGRPYNEEINLLYAADQVAFNMLLTNARNGWERPIYFAVTVSPDGQLGLQNFFQLEGQAFRVVPIEHNESQLGRVVPEITLDRLSQFQFTNLADPDVYYDENIRNMVDNYRNVFSHAAEQAAQQGYREEAIGLLDSLMVNVPFSTIPGDPNSFIFMARAYQAAGADDRAVAVMKEAEPVVLHALQTATSSRAMERAARDVQLINFVYYDARDFEAASAFSEKLADVLGDEGYRRTPDEIRQEFEQLMDSVPAEPGTPPAAPGTMP